MHVHLRVAGERLHQAARAAEQPHIARHHDHGALPRRRIGERGDDVRRLHELASHHVGRHVDAGKRAMSADDHVGDVDRVERRAREQVGVSGPRPDDR